jgi:hypothetical protein
VPRLLSIDQKEHRVAVCSELKEQTLNDPNFISNFISNITTHDDLKFTDMTLRRSSKWKIHHQSKRHEKFEAI